MGNVTINKPSLFIMMEDGEPIPIGEVIEVETIEEHSKDDCDEIIGHICTSNEVTIEFTPNYFNQKLITELFFGITNNCRRIHGGFALRERTRYKWYKKYKRNCSYD